MTAKTNPLLAVARTRSAQSLEVAPALVQPQVFDTTTPAVLSGAVRRFSLGDLPKYADEMFVSLHEIFPHINTRMYGGWLRSCIQDNASYFVCLDNAVMLAQVMHDPMDPRPYVQIVFALGDKADKTALLKDTLRWARMLGAIEARAYDIDLEKDPEILIRSRTMSVFPLE